MAQSKPIITPENLQVALDELKTRVVRPEAGKGLSTNDLTDELKAKYDQAAQKVDSISVPTKVSQLENDSKYQTESQVTSAINAKVSSVYKPGGSIAFASLPELSASVLGMVYNVTDAFTTTTDFVDGSGKKYPAGTNVVVVDAGSGSYKFDVLAGFVDLSGYATTSAMNSAIATAKSEAISSANSSTDGKLADYVKSADLVPVTTEEIQAMFDGWDA
ncbi:hypothetical protein [Faecalibacterium sp. An122]|uniref:hypothetical protein n=1 Tax=Faecalibacterium sp. An122 TaxID=1965551 RepID=UPI000B3A087B|nr:hypothetical protein [Faecalibacterium sp. An122]OUQ35626.1 hypothetical protein B5E67_11560 [Faecalibacterium sp. An122]